MGPTFSKEGNLMRGKKSNGRLLSAKNLSDYAVYLIVRLAICIVQMFPLAVCQSGARGIALLLWYGFKLRRSVIEENLRTAFSHLSAEQHEQIALAMWQHLIVMVAEIAHAPRKVHRTNWREHTDFPRRRDLVQRLLDSRPVVILSGHFGNFEIGGYLMGLHGFPTHTIARPLDNSYLDRFVNRFRGATGQYMLPKFGSSKQIARVLERGGTLVLLGDQNAGARACWVDFFGRPASTHKAVAIFTLSGNAPTAVCGVARKGRPLHFEMRVEDLIDPQEVDGELGTVLGLTQWYTACLERLIRSAPEQYWWIHRRWKGKPRKRSAHRCRQQAA
jgi:KDO2-lipid IV(A) lauroyltransferase